MGTELLITVLVFAAIVLFGLGLFFYTEYHKERRELMRRMKGVEDGISSEGISSEEKPAIFYPIDMFKRYFVRTARSVGDKIEPKGEEDRSGLRKTFLKAGLRGENTPVVFFGIKAFLTVLFPVIFILLKLSVLKTVEIVPLHFMLLCVILALIGFYSPNLWLRNKIARRQRKIFEGFPDALDLMVVCVEAGAGLDAAVNRVGEEMEFSNEVVSEEFRLLSLELRAGKSRQDALRNLALRTGVEEVSSLVTLLIQTERFGTSIGQALRVHSDSMRTKRQQKAEEVAAKLPVKLVFPLILFIFPALFVVILGPAVIRIFRVLFPALGGQ